MGSNETAGEGGVGIRSLPLVTTRCRSGHFVFLEEYPDTFSKSSDHSSMSSVLLVEKWGTNRLDRHRHWRVSPTLSPSVERGLRFLFERATSTEPSFRTLEPGYYYRSRHLNGRASVEYRSEELYILCYYFGKYSYHYTIRPISGGFLLAPD